MSSKINKSPDFLRMAKELLDDARIYAEKEGVDFFVSSFDDEGFTDVAFVPWQKRRDELVVNCFSSTSLLVPTVPLILFVASFMLF